MLTPQQIIDIIETMYPTIDELNVWITKDLIQRLMARLGRGKELFLTVSDEWQLQVFQSAGGHLESVQKEIERWTKISDAEIQRIFEDAGIKALAYDSDFYIAHGLEGFSLGQSEGMIRLLEDTYQRTTGTIHNFTRTTAKASQQRLINALDTAHFKVSSGTTYRTPMKRNSLFLTTSTHRRWTMARIQTLSKTPQGTVWLSGRTGLESRILLTLLSRPNALSETSKCSWRSCGKSYRVIPRSWEC